MTNTIHVESLCGYSRLRAAHNYAHSFLYSISCLELQRMEVTLSKPKDGHIVNQLYADCNDKLGIVELRISNKHQADLTCENPTLNFPRCAQSQYSFHLAYTSVHTCKLFRLPTHNKLSHRRLGNPLPRRFKWDKSSMTCKAG